MKNEFTFIDFNTWPRAEQFKAFTDVFGGVLSSCTKKIDVTTLKATVKKAGTEFVPALMWLTARELNKCENFKLGFKDGKLGCHSYIQPMYPVLKKDGNFAYHTVPYTVNFKEYLEAYRREKTGYLEDKKFFAGEMPDNTFTLSVTPYISFDNVTFFIRNFKHYLAPIVVFDKYEEIDGKLILNCCLTASHAVIDAWHYKIFYEGLQQSFDDSNKLLND